MKFMNFYNNLLQDSNIIFQNFVDNIKIVHNSVFNLGLGAFFLRTNNLYTPTDSLQPGIKILHLCVAQDVNTLTDWRPHTTNVLQSAVTTRPPKGDTGGIGIAPRYSPDSV